jgi:hypothetical protein
MNAIISSAALAISFCSLLISFYFWTRSFRPIVTAAVKTHAAGNEAILYDLVVLNSGTIPARNIRIQAAEQSLAAAFGGDATPENKQRWIACFDQVILILQNNDRVSCSFGTTKAADTGFWKHNATISVIITYEGWFGSKYFPWKYEEKQDIRITDSDSFTGYSWG